MYAVFKYISMKHLHKASRMFGDQHPHGLFCVTSSLYLKKT